MNQNDTYTLIHKIREKYTKTEPSRLDALIALDKKIARPAKIGAYIFGGVGALVMGSGMSLIMTDIAASLGMAQPTMATGIIIGVVGLAMAAVNYPIYRAMVSARRRRHADEILAISQELLDEQEA